MLVTVPVLIFVGLSDLSKRENLLLKQMQNLQIYS